MKTKLILSLAIGVQALLSINCAESRHIRYPDGMNSMNSPSGQQSDLAFPGSSGSTGGVTGAQLFQQRCAGCHGNVTTMGPRSLNQVEAALASVTAMAGVASITTPEERRAIADALNGINTTIGGGANSPPPAALTGQQLYQVNCAGCHGQRPPDDARSVNGILEAIEDESEMAGLSVLTAAERQLIADYIRGNLQTADDD